MAHTETPGGALPSAAPPGPLCSRCHLEPAKPGQRWGKDCHAAYMRVSRARAAARRRRAAAARASLTGLVDELRGQLPGWPS